ncbi:MAG: polysulfide reductase, partial [Myxococcales bacterium]|nr:polysulfide reductase [Myxococcales bacterium]
SLELLEVLSVAYKQTHEWEILSKLIKERLWLTYVVLQFGTFSVVPFLMLFIANVFRIDIRKANLITWAAATMLLAQVLLMRWNVVIGGQLLSKSFRGFTSYFPGFWEKEGLIAAAVVFTMPFFILYVFHRIIPLFPNAEAARVEAKGAES